LARVIYSVVSGQYSYTMYVELYTLINVTIQWPSQCGIVEY